MESNTVTQRETGSISEVSQHQEKIIQTPVFIIFAEYLGYVSRFNQIAVDWCDGKVPETYIQDLLIMEAKSIFRQMKKDYTIEEIQYWYDTYRPVILKDYEDKLAAMATHIDCEDED
jgi:hypothetical protein